MANGDETDQGSMLWPVFLGGLVLIAMIMVGNIVINAASYESPLKDLQARECA